MQQITQIQQLAYSLQWGFTKHHIKVAAVKSPRHVVQNPSTVLFTHYGDEWIRGSERCLLDLLSHLDHQRFKPIVWCNSAAMANEVRHLDIPLIRSDFPLLLGWQQPRFAVRAFYKLIKQGIQLVDKHGVTLIHANSGAPNQWLNAVARARQLPLLTHLHSRYPLRDRITLGLHQLTMAVGVSQPIIAQLLQDGMSPEHTCVIPNGIDTTRLDQQQRIDLRNMLALDRNDFLIATAGSLIHRKGIDLIIDSIARLIRLGIPAQLVIIGDGPERANLQQQIQRLGIQDRVHMMGEQSNVVGLLRGGVDMFVSAAREEVFGLVLAEAGLARLAVVAPAVGGIPDVVIDGKTGKLVPAENITALTHALYQFYLAPPLREKMGKAGRRHVLANFTIQHNVQQFEQLYSLMLQNPAMHMRWHRHWKLYRSITNISKQLLDLLINKFYREVTP